MKSAVYSVGCPALQPFPVPTLTWPLADVIKKLRKEKGWKREKLAKRADVAYVTITRLEQGREMKEASIRAVASALGLSLSELYALVPNERALTADEIDWLRLLRALPDQDARDAVLNFARNYGAPASEDPEQEQSRPFVRAVKERRTNPRKKGA